MSDVVLMNVSFDLLGPVGAFGKMPSQGDFFRIDLPAGFASAWDAWLSATLQTARARLGERWQECYYSAPIWRFTLAPGEAGQQALMGILMPSVDRVGRAFPLTLVAPVPDSSATAAGHMALASRFGALEVVALEALDDAMTQPALRQELDGMQATFLLASDVPVAPIPREFHGVAARGHWSALVDGHMAYLATPALPTANELVAMLDLSDPHWAPEAVE